MFFKTAPTFFISLIFCIFQISNLSATTYYVKTDGADTNDGLSWDNAVQNLQTAIDLALPDDEIWVAEGTYYPTVLLPSAPNDPRYYSFYIEKDIKIFGGFDGISTDFNDRNWATHPTILSGNIGDPNMDTDNLVTVLYTKNLTANFLLDGFSIQDGYANDGAADANPAASGGGWFNTTDAGLPDNSNPIVQNCVFSNNYALYGGAVFNYGIAPNDTSPSFINCIFKENTSITRGGGIYNYSTEPSGSTNALFRNCLFYDNMSSQGGAVYNHADFGMANPDFFNCTFSENVATSTGGAVLNVTVLNGISVATFTNSIFWNNGDEITSINDGAAQISFCIFDDGNPDGNLVFDPNSNINDQGNNSDADPNFTNNIDKDFRPRVCSPAIDAGSNTLPTDFSDLDSDMDIIEPLPLDLDHNSRIFDNGTVDIGAYELQMPNIAEGGTLAESTTVCSGTNSTTLTLSGHNGEIDKWQYDTDINFSNPTSFGGMDAMETIENLTETTHYRVSIENGTCPPTNSSIATITVDEVSVGGTLDGTTLHCSLINSTTLSLDGEMGTITKWQYDEDENFSNPIDISNTTNTHTVENLQQHTFFRVEVTNGVCPPAYSTTAQVFVTEGYETLFVDGSKAASGNGSSWDEAFLTLQEAIDIASCSATSAIWVADGTYYPTRDTAGELTTGRYATFFLDYSVEIYGGFAGGELSLEDRDWENNKTILCGDVGVLDDDTDNSYNVMHTANVGEGFILDGLCFTKGQTLDGFGQSFETWGGGLFNESFGSGNSSNLLVQNCSFYENFASAGAGAFNSAYEDAEANPQFINCQFYNNLVLRDSGGAVGNIAQSGANSNASFIDCSFTQNIAPAAGAIVSIGSEGNANIHISNCSFIENEGLGSFFSGAIVNAAALGEANSIIEDCYFYKNKGVRGGAINTFSQHGTVNPIIKNCIFSENTATEQGGAIYNLSTITPANPKIINCTFSKNSCQLDGGVIFNESQQGVANPEFINCSFTQNSTMMDGGVLYNVATDGFASPEFINCTLANNTADNQGNTLFNAIDNSINGSSLVSTIFQNSILWNGGDEIHNEDGTSTLLENTIINDGTIDGVLTLPDNTFNGGNVSDADPLLLNPDNGDVHLMPCSPAIDAGNNGDLPQDEQDLDEDMNIFEPLSQDLDKLPRMYNGGTVDIGAYEYHGDPNNTIFYVDSAAVGYNYGSSWEYAFTDLSDALAAAAECTSITEIRVAKGTYFPTRDRNRDPSTSREATFFIDFDIELYGGFDANMNERNAVSNATILSGDIGILEDNIDNTYSVIHTQNVSGDFIMDGFTITGGNANISPVGFTTSDSGGGWFNEAIGTGQVSNPTISNCSFMENIADLGGAMINFSDNGGEASPNFNHCSFIKNTSNGDGGALANVGNGSASSPIISNCIFTENQAPNGYGGALFNYGLSETSSPYIANCLFSLNIGGDGGAVCNYGGSNAPVEPDFSNCVFVNNEGFNRGGAVFNFSEASALNAAFINCSFSKNSANGGGAMYNNTIDGGTLFVTINNSILWDDTDEINNPGGIVLLLNSIYDDGSPDGTANLPNNVNPSNVSDADPFYVDAANNDLQLQSCSPAIDAGENSALPDDTADLDGDLDVSENLPLDLNNNVRIYNAATVDLGAYEYQAEFCPPLAAEWLDFQAKLLEEEKVLLTWQSVSSTPLAFFEIEYSLDGQYFETIARLTADENNRFWEWTHLQPEKGVNYYRIVAIDVQGNQSISTIRSIFLDKNQIAVFPNPTDGLTYLSIQNLDAVSATLSLTDALGQQLWMKKVSTDEIEQQVVPIDLKQWGSGVYFVKIDDGKRIWTERVVKR